MKGIEDPEPKKKNDAQRHREIVSVLMGYCDIQTSIKFEVNLFALISVWPLIMNGFNGRPGKRQLQVYCN
jgi:hypothetical protein